MDGCLAAELDVYEPHTLNGSLFLMLIKKHMLQPMAVVVPFLFY